ncbi:MAG: GTP-binding protein GTP1/Obg family [Pseudomonadota bacterium]|jgi:GTP-binding protein
MKFVDSTEILIRAGDGGPGMVSFKTARNKPKLGCDGGDGGHGGNVILVGNRQLNTLSSLRYKRTYEAGHGQRGGTNNKTGANGEDLIIPVPLGTQVFDADSGKMTGEVLGHQQKLVVAKGGERGLGNQRFLTSTHQAPEEFTEGTKGETAHLRLELKLLADVGLAGFPNAGKSTLLSVMSAAKPKVADYPFTTLVPNLGVVELTDKSVFAGESFVMADVPGLIEGASEGKGLGHSFLRHLERTQLIAYLVTAVNAEEIAPVDALKTLQAELASYSPELAAKPACVVLSKTDLIEADDRNQEIKHLAAPIEKMGLDVLAISSVEQDGITELKRYLFDRVTASKAAQQAEEGEETVLDDSVRGRQTRRWLDIPGVRLELTADEAADMKKLPRPDLRTLLADG